MSKRLLLVAFIAGLAGYSAQAVSQQAGGCSLTAPEMTIHRANIFSAQQEQWLGDAEAEGVEPHYPLLPVDKSAYLTKVGEKLLAQLPPTTIHYRFRVFESNELTSFSLAGGHVYVSRKLVLDARNEDELAGVLAHEIGTISIHHTATVYTRAMDKLLGVKTLGGEADVRDKFQKLLNVPRDILQYKWNPTLSIKDMEDDALEADQVGYYAFVKAGYSPASYAAILDRATMNSGYKGNIFTDALDLTTNVSMRVRAAEKMNKSLPASCGGVQPRDRAEFKAFQAYLNRQRVNPLVAPTQGLKAIELDPPMSPALENVRLSPDGKYLLAQDELRIHVLSRQPLKVLYSINAPNARMAQFTPDSADLVFYYSGLRFEEWKAATGEREQVHDIADYAGCLQDSLSPDGKYFACFSRNFDRHERLNGGVSYGWLKLSELGTGRMVYEDKNFYLPNFRSQAPTIAVRAVTEPRQASVAWSQDGRYFAAASGTAAVGVDLKSGEKLKLGGELEHLYESRMAFVDSDKLAYECDWGYKEGGPRDTFKSCYSTFPEGSPQNTFTLGRTWLAGVTEGHRLLTGPANDAAAVLFDPATGEKGQSFKLDPVDMAAGLVAAEAERGGVSVGPVGGEMETIALPVTPLPSLETARFSADGRFLAISDRARGAVWDLSTGKQVSLSGPFRHAQFDGEDKLEARIASHEFKPARDPLIDRRTGKVAPTLSIVAEQIQYGSVLVRYKPLEKDQELYFNVAIEAEDAASGAHLWRRQFTFDPPMLLDTDGDQLLLLMDRRSRTGGDEVDRNRKITVRTSDMTKEFLESGAVIEIISRRTGQPERMVLAPEMAGGRSAALYGDLLAVRGNSNNTVVYRTTDGARLFSFAGRALEGDAGLGLIAASNEPQDVTIYEAASGKELRHVTLDNNVLAARFIPATKQLLVLTATERVYTLDLPAAQETSAAK
jgi:hypothetical protein